MDDKTALANLKAATDAAIKCHEIIGNISCELANATELTDSLHGAICNNLTQLKNALPATDFPQRPPSHERGVTLADVPYLTAGNAIVGHACHVFAFLAERLKAGSDVVSTFAKQSAEDMQATYERLAGVILAATSEDIWRSLPTMCRQDYAFWLEQVSAFDDDAKADEINAIAGSLPQRSNSPKLLRYLAKHKHATYGEIADTCKLLAQDEKSIERALRRLNERLEEVNAPYRAKWWKVDEENRSYAKLIDSTE